MTTAGTAFCLKCGRNMPVYKESLDTNRPFVRCEWQTRDGEYHGHGVTLGTRSDAESADVLQQCSDHRQRQAHVRGTHHEKKSKRCPDCQKAVAA